VQTARIISIVDDDELIRAAISSLARSLGWQTYTFASGEEFLTSSRIAETACLITDIRMPGMSGIELHSRLLDLGFESPTIFITAFPTDALRTRVMADGAIALLGKPVDPNAIIECIDQVAKRL
jgi:FixJ family two-component response regulator